VWWCGGVVVAGQVLVWWSPDNYFLFSNYFKNNPFIVTGPPPDKYFLFSK
jgi:hypothetical protein